MLPGLEHGLLPLALLCLRVLHARPAPAGERTDWGPSWPQRLVLDQYRHICDSEPGQDLWGVALGRTARPSGTSGRSAR